MHELLSNVKASLHTLGVAKVEGSMHDESAHRGCSLSLEDLYISVS